MENKIKETFFNLIKFRIPDRIDNTELMYNLNGKIQIKISWGYSSSSREFKLYTPSFNNGNPSITVGTSTFSMMGSYDVNNISHQYYIIIINNLQYYVPLTNTELNEANQIVAHVMKNFQEELIKDTVYFVDQLMNTLG